MEQQNDYVTQEEVGDALEMLGQGYDHPTTPQGFASPNYTQAPNDFYDYYLKRINSLAELKVVDTIIRHTFGYHRDMCRMGIQEIADYAGLSYNSVVTGAEAAEKRGLIKRLNPDTKEKAEWTLVVHEPSNFEGSNFEGVDPQTLRVEPSGFEGQVRVKERLKKKKKKGSGGPKLTDIPELVLYREIVKHWPKPFQREAVIQAVRSISTRLGRPATQEDLAPFWAAWGGVSGNEWSLVWLTDWAVSGQGPQRPNGHKPAKTDQPVQPQLSPDELEQLRAKVKAQFQAEGRIP